MKNVLLIVLSVFFSASAMAATSPFAKTFPTPLSQNFSDSLVGVTQTGTDWVFEYRLSDGHGAHKTDYVHVPVSDAATADLAQPSALTQMTQHKALWLEDLQAPSTPTVPDGITLGPVTLPPP